MKRFRSKEATMTDTRNGAGEARMAELIEKVFKAKTFMMHLGVRMGRVSPGQCELLLAPKPEHLQHGGWIHGGVIGALADNAAGGAAATLAPPGYGTVTVEYKINYLKPCRGPELAARARVVRAGKSVTVCLVEVVSRGEANESVDAIALATLAPFPLAPAA